MVIVISAVAPLTVAVLWSSASFARENKPILISYGCLLISIGVLVVGGVKGGIYGRETVRLDWLFVFEVGRVTWCGRLHHPIPVISLAVALALSVTKACLLVIYLHRTQRGDNRLGQSVKMSSPVELRCMITSESSHLLQGILIYCCP